MPVVLQSARFNYRCFRQWSTSCLLTVANLPTLQGCTVWLSALGIEPGLARLVVQEISRRATVSTSVIGLNQGSVVVMPAASTNPMDPRSYLQVQLGQTRVTQRLAGLSPFHATYRLIC